MESSMLDHDTVIFFGDLNYRIVTELSKDTVLHLSKANTETIASGTRRTINSTSNVVTDACFRGSPRVRFTFHPTYKMQIGAGIYEEREERNTVLQLGAIVYLVLLSHH